MLKSLLINQHSKFKMLQILNKYKPLKHGDKKASLKLDKNAYKNLEKIIHKTFLICILNLIRV